MPTVNDSNEAVRQWLASNKRLVKTATAKQAKAGAPWALALLTRPDILASVTRDLAAQAKSAGAPTEVVRALTAQAASYKRGAAKAPSVAYAWLAVARLQGIETKARARTILEAALKNAPDQENREFLERALFAVSSHVDENARPGRPGNTPPPMRMADCARGCAIGCIICSSAGLGCLLCCAIGCGAGL